MTLGKDSWWLSNHDVLAIDFCTVFHDPSIDGKSQTVFHDPSIDGWRATMAKTFVRNEHLSSLVCYKFTKWIPQRCFWKRFDQIVTYEINNSQWRGRLLILVSYVFHVENGFHVMAMCRCSEIHQAFIMCDLEPVNDNMDLLMTCAKQTLRFATWREFYGNVGLFMDACVPCNLCCGFCSQNCLFKRSTNQPPHQLMVNLGWRKNARWSMCWMLFVLYGFHWGWCWVSESETTTKPKCDRSFAVSATTARKVVCWVVVVVDGNVFFGFPCRHCRYVTH